MKRPRQLGQALAEFALILPLFLVLLIGIVDFGRAVWAVNSLRNAAAEAARFTIVHGGSPGDPCPVGPPGPQAQNVAASASCPHPSPSKQSIYDTARSFAVAGGSPVSVTVCYGAGCTGNTDITSPEPATNTRGTPVTVVVASTVTLITPSLLGANAFNLSGTSTMLVNH